MPSLIIKQDLVPKVRQMIVLAEFMKLPEYVLDSVVEGISKNPDTIEKALTSEKGGDARSDTEKVRVIFDSTNGNGDPKKRRGGIILTPDLRGLEDAILGEERETGIIPDVTYTGRTKAKPEMRFADHFNRPLKLSIVQIDRDKFSKTAKLIDSIKFFDGWRIGHLRNIYGILGEYQREFFEDFNTTQLLVCDQNTLGDIVELSNSTIGRLLTNRYVKVISVDGETRYFPTKMLCVTSDHRKKYIVLNRLNDLLEEEFGISRPYSDQILSERLQNVARRTIAAYRKEFRIPDHGVRGENYFSGKTEPYKIVIDGLKL